MRICYSDSGTPITRGRFTGRVELSMLAAATSPDRPDAAVGRFHDGAVTYWHTHPGGQLLFVHAGTARVGTDATGAVTIPTGGLVVAEPGERHWHGADHASDCALLTLTWGTTAWEDAAPL
jgi:quercetin dioxygenase-like cupin family protein